MVGDTLGVTEDGPSYLQNLNAAQRKAVLIDPTVPLQILAGPGSGKTRVLTTRIVHFLLHHKIDPTAIVAVTFTNKAAREMKQRLVKMVGAQTVDKLVLGTFHATCVRYLRRHGSRMNPPLSPNWSVCDEDQVRKITDEIAKSFAEQMREMSVEIKGEMVRNAISTAKAHNEGPEDVRTNALAQQPIDRYKILIAQMYDQYQARLKEINAFDFDDLLVYGVRLFEQIPTAAEHIQVLLVDEFQDINKAQYKLMNLMTAHNRHVSIVGDPDQSIYGWRAADVENLKKMIAEFPGTQQIFLEENYRSTGSIVSAAVAVVAQDPDRPPKTLYTSHAQGTKATLRQVRSAPAEAAWIVREIKRIVAHSGGGIQYGDCAILLRYNALSRNLETALQKENVPVRMLAGSKFFDRAEVKDILAYLQLIDNPEFTPAFLRAVNTPKRGIGPKTLQDINDVARAAGLKPYVLIEKIVDGKSFPCMKPTWKKLSSMVNPIRKCRRMAKARKPAAEIIKVILEEIDYQAYLEHHCPMPSEAASRWENVQELVTFAASLDKDKDAPNTEVPAELPEAVEKAVNEEPGETGEYKRELFAVFNRNKREKNVESEEEVAADDDENPTPLRSFLAASTLSTDVEEKDENGDEVTSRVTIATAHAAKGLEWPVVFVPAVEKGTFPFYRCTTEHQIAEERRLLYVAMTRAQGLLYMTHCKVRMPGGEDKPQELSEFLIPLSKTTKYFVTAPPTFTPESRKTLAGVIGREPIDEGVVAEMIADFDSNVPPWNDAEWEPSDDVPPASHGGSRLGRPLSRSNSWNSSSLSGSGSGNGFSFSQRSSKPTQPPPGAPMGFVSASTGFGNAFAAYRAQKRAQAAASGSSSRAPNASSSISRTSSSSSTPSSSALSATTLPPSLSSSSLPPPRPASIFKPSNSTFAAPSTTASPQQLPSHPAHTAHPFLKAVSLPPPRAPQPTVNSFQAANKSAIDTFKNLGPSDAAAATTSQPKGAVQLASGTRRLGMRAGGPAPKKRKSEP